MLSRWLDLPATAAKEATELGKRKGVPLFFSDRAAGVAS